MTMFGRRIIAAALAMLIAAPAARAQVSTGIVAPNPAATDPFLAPAVRVGQDLLDIGILPRLRYIDAFAANPIGGLKTGADNSGVVIFGADLDMNRIVGIPGGVVHVGFAQLYGHELSTDNIGSRTKVQTYYYPYKQFELSELTYEQSLFGDKMNLLAGRANATGEFARDAYGCRFENVANCPFELTQLVGGFPGFPYVNWGGRVRVRPTDSFYIKAGAYEVNSLRNRNSGFDWSTTNATGLVLPVEFGYGTTFASDPMPRDLKAGMWYNSAPYSDPLLNTKHTSRALFGGAPLTHPGGRTGAYLLADQMVWRPDAETQRGITIFGATGAPFDTAELYTYQAVLGAIWTGALPSRPFDQIGLLANVIQLTRKEDNYLNELLTKARSTSAIPRTGYVFEINYGYRIAPGVVIQPDLQYLVNPDDINRTSTKVAPRDALVVGIKFSVNANQLLGLPETLAGVPRASE